MVGASKILTVSYGTFSCTLEGFDDPFNTMKAIAEYFRDLAADDRYFGAEPPTPDAAMLHRIAEREIQRRVEAKVEDNGVILRAHEAPVAEKPTVSPASQPKPAESSPAAPTAGLFAEESVAAKLQRIRSAVARAAATPAPVIEDAVFVDEDSSLPVTPMSAFPAAAETGPDRPREEATGNVVAFAPTPQQEVTEAPEPLVLPQDELAGPAYTPVEVAETEAEEQLEEATLDLSFLDLSDTSRVEETVVDAEEAEPVLPEAVAGLDDEFDLPEDELDQDEEEALIAALTARSEIEQSVSGGDQFEDDAPIADHLLSVQSATVVEGPDEQTTEDADAAALRWIEAAEDDAEDAEASFEGMVAEQDAEEAEEEWAVQPSVTEDVAHAAETVQADEENTTWPTDPEQPAIDPAIEEKLRRARARVIKVRRPDVDTGSVEADVAMPAAVEPLDQSEPPRGEGRTILEANAKGDEDVSRLLRQTNSEMDGPENRRRMSTLAHLKAAVAATVAELRSSGAAAPESAEPKREASRLERYRADLARVVRPRRPTDEPSADRPAPLVLVSEQRIDAPAPKPETGRVLPRRVTSGNLALDDDEDIEADEGVDSENIFANSRSFAEFAERLGATELPDLLEAAAAYTACIEGRPHFSRPHLMRHVAAIAEDVDANREDGLRSFGQLLRTGKIEKVKRGQFAITDHSHYLAEARRMTR